MNLRKNMICIEKQNISQSSNNRVIICEYIDQPYDYQVSVDKNDYTLLFAEKALENRRETVVDKREWDKDYTVYAFQGEINVRVGGTIYTLREALLQGRIDIETILGRAYQNGNTSINNYEYQSDNWTLVKLNTSNGNKDVYIGNRDFLVHNLEGVIHADEKNRIEFDEFTKVMMSALDSTSYSSINHMDNYLAGVLGLDSDNFVKYIKEMKYYEKGLEFVTTVRLKDETNASQVVAKEASDDAGWRA